MTLTNGNFDGYGPLHDLKPLETRHWSDPGGGPNQQDGEGIEIYGVDIVGVNHYSPDPMVSSGALFNIEDLSSQMIRSADEVETITLIDNEWFELNANNPKDILYEYAQALLTSQELFNPHTNSLRSIAESKLYYVWEEKNKYKYDYYDMPSLEQGPGEYGLVWKFKDSPEVMYHPITGEQIEEPQPPQQDNQAAQPPQTAPQAAQVPLALQVTNKEKEKYVIDTLASNFDTYAATDGDAASLSDAELDAVKASFDPQYHPQIDAIKNMNKDSLQMQETYTIAKLQAEGVSLRGIEVRLANPAIVDTLLGMNRGGFTTWAGNLSLEELNSSVSALNREERVELINNLLVLDANLSVEGRENLVNALDEIFAHPDIGGLYAEILSYTSVDPSGPGTAFSSSESSIDFNSHLLETGAPKYIRNVLMHELLHSFNQKEGDLDGALDEGSAIFIFKTAFPDDFDPNQSWAEATFGTKNYYREFKNYNIKISNLTNPSTRMIEVFNWLQERDPTHLPWNDKAALKYLYKNFYEELDKNAPNWFDLAAQADQEVISSEVYGHTPIQMSDLLIYPENDPSKAAEYINTLKGQMIESPETDSIRLVDNHWNGNIQSNIIFNTYSVALNSGANWESELGLAWATDPENIDNDNIYAMPSLENRDEQQVWVLTVNGEEQWYSIMDGSRVN